MSLLLLNLFVIFSLMTLLWLISLPLRDVSIIDLFWGPGFVLVAWVSFLKGGVLSPERLLLPALVTLWGLRLGAYLTYRNWGQPEDKRYAAMRKRTGPRFTGLSLIMVFWLQGALMWFISLPLQLGIPAGPTEMPGLAVLGTLVWLTGFFFEAVGDWQLLRFRANPDNRGQVLDRGLWRYTRHPNYFGDFLVWWGFWLIAVAAGDHFWTAVSPLAMSIFLMYVSGVTLLEKDLTQSKPGYADYIRRTNAFFPGPRKSDGNTGVA